MENANKLVESASSGKRIYHLCVAPAHHFLKMHGRNDLPGLVVKCDTRGMGAENQRLGQFLGALLAALVVDLTKGFAGVDDVEICLLNLNIGAQARRAIAHLFEDGHLELLVRAALRVLDRDKLRHPDSKG